MRLGGKSMRRCSRLWVECSAGLASPGCNMRQHFGTVFIALVILSTLTMIQAQSTPKETIFTMHAIGPFDVRVTPQEDGAGDRLLNRMTLDKQYHGDLEGTGKGQMLTAGTE